MIFSKLEESQTEPAWPADFQPGSGPERRAEPFVDRCSTSQQFFRMKIPNDFSTNISEINN